MVRIEDVTKKINTLSVETAEAEGAHILKMHARLDETQLIRHAKETYEGASTFQCSNEKITMYIRKTLADYADWICDWLNDDSDGEPLECALEMDETVGIGYYRENWHEWNTGAVKSSGIRVVIKKVERKYDTTFSIITAYPYATEADKKNHLNGLGTIS